jgi:hypothetical protein
MHQTVYTYVHVQIAQRRRRHCGGLQSLAFATRLGVLIRALALTINLHRISVPAARRHCSGLQARSRPFGSAESVQSLAVATRLGVLIRALALTINLHRISVPAASGPQHQNAGLFVFASLLLLLLECEARILVHTRSESQR